MAAAAKIEKLNAASLARITMLLQKHALWRVRGRFQGESSKRGFGRQQIGPLRFTLLIRHTRVHAFSDLKVARSELQRCKSTELIPEQFDSNRVFD
jgi:hypothetical protein